MPYQSDTISTIVNRLNAQYFLPAIQREFVWDPDQIIQLFDSIMRGYPISSFLFWEIKAENRDKWEVYSFIQDFKQGGSHNQIASTHGVPQLVLALDGQQRLTSLMIALKGSYTIKKKYKRWDSPDAWVKQRLYLDLLKDPKTEEDESEFGVRYSFRFMDKSPRNDADHYWFKVGQILDFDSEDVFYEFRQAEKEKLPDETTKKQIATFERNLERLYRAVWKDAVVAYYTEQDQDYDRVLDIFVRANEGGTKLSKSDLLLSMMTSKWGGETNARDEIYGFVDRLNNDLSWKNNFDKDLIMKSCLVLCDLPVQYKVENFSNTNLELIRTKWKDIKAALETGVNLVNTFGIDRDTLTSANALIPILYYLYQHPKTTLQGSTPFEVQNAARVRRFLTMALLNNVFGGTSDNLLRDIRQVLQARGKQDFPIEAISEKAAQSGRSAHFDDFAIENFLSVTYGKQLTFLALSLLYEENRWGILPYHQDHIFPRGLFTHKKMDDAGLSADQEKRYLELMNRIGNLELLLAHENEEKSDQIFETWIRTRDASFLDRHLIPQDKHLFFFTRFEDFVREREKLIRQRLQTLFPVFKIEEEQ